MFKTKPTNRLANGKTTVPKTSIFSSIPAPKPQASKTSSCPVSFELDEPNQEIVIRVKLADEPKLTESGKSYRIAAMPSSFVDTGMKAPDGRAIKYGRGAFVVPV